MYLLEIEDCEWGLSEYTSIPFPFRSGHADSTVLHVSAAQHTPGLGRLMLKPCSLVSSILIE